MADPLLQLCAQTLLEFDQSPWIVLHILAQISQSSFFLVSLDLICIHLIFDFVSGVSNAPPKIRCGGLGLFKERNGPGKQIRPSTFKGSVCLFCILRRLLYRRKRFLFPGHHLLAYVIDSASFPPHFQRQFLTSIHQLFLLNNTLSLLLLKSFRFLIDIALGNGTVQFPLPILFLTNFCG